LPQSSLWQTEQVQHNRCVLIKTFAYKIKNMTCGL